MVEKTNNQTNTIQNIYLSLVNRDTGRVASPILADKKDTAQKLKDLNELLVSVFNLNSEFFMFYSDLPEGHDGLHEKAVEISKRYLKSNKN